MIVGGWISFIIGIIMSIFGMIAYNDANSAGYGLSKYIDSSDMDASRIIITLGIILLMAGIAMLIIGYMQKYSNKNNVHEIAGKYYSRNDSFQPERVCLKCGAMAPSKESNFCAKCGSPLGKTNFKQDNFI